MLAERPAPPEGYRLVERGKVCNHDLCWGRDTGTWDHPTAVDFEVLGREVQFYYAVARRVPGTGKTRKEPRDE